MGSIISWLTSSAVSALINPILNTVTAIFTKKEDVSLEKFKIDGVVDTALISAQVAVFQAQMEMAKSRVMQFLYVAFSLPLAFHLAKVYIWDADLHLGTSDAVKGDVAQWAMMIVGFIFFHSAISNWSRKT